MTGPFDPVLACGAMLGALGFVGMALMWAIEGVGRANDRRRWDEERADLLAELVDARTDATEGWADARRGWADAREGWTAAAGDAHACEDAAALTALHAKAAHEGLFPPEAMN